MCPDFSIRNLKSLLPGQAEFEVRTPRFQNANEMVIFTGTAACAKRLRSAASNRCRAFRTPLIIPCANAPGNDLRVAQPADQLNSRFSLQQNNIAWFMHSTTRRTSHYVVRVVLCCSVLCCYVLCCSMLSSAALQALCCAL